MQLSNQGLKFLQQREGFDPKCRLPNGSWKAHYDKIGKVYDMPYGICFDVDGSRVKADSIWTDEKVNHVFKLETEKFERGINKILSGISLTQYQFDALFSFAWNIGINGFRGSTVVQRIKAGNYAGVPQAMMKWTKNKELIPRRELEVALWSGDYGRD